MVKQTAAQRDKLTSWTIAKIANCGSLNQAASLKATMLHKGAYRAAVEAAYNELRARLYPDAVSA